MTNLEEERLCKLQQLAAAAQALPGVMAAGVEHWLLLEIKILASELWPRECFYGDSSNRLHLFVDTRCIRCGVIVFPKASGEPASVGHE